VGWSGGHAGSRVAEWDITIWDRISWELVSISKRCVMTLVRAVMRVGSQGARVDESHALAQNLRVEAKNVLPFLGG
jgi:hypothetical protein